MTDSSTRIFYSNAQSFWKKNIYYLKHLNPGIWSGCDLIFENGKLQFEIKTGESLKIRHKELRTIDDRVGNELLSFLSGMKPVQLIDDDMEDSDKIFDLQIVDQKYSVYLNDEYLIVWYKDLYYYYNINSIISCFHI